MWAPLLSSPLFTNDLFLSESAPQDTANRWGLKNLAVAGIPSLSRSSAQRSAGRTRKKEGALSFRAAVREPAEGLAPTEHHVGQETLPGSTGHCQQEAPFFGVTAGQ